jgi:hypothetical protein
MLLNLSVGRQTYAKDCEVCCQPVGISFIVEEVDLTSFYAKRLDQGGPYHGPSTLAQIYHR